MVGGSWQVVDGAWYMVHGTWYMVGGRYRCEVRLMVTRLNFYLRYELTVIGSSLASRRVEIRRTIWIPGETSW